MADSGQLVLNLQPFGELKRERFFWLGKTKIGFWAGCRTRSDEYSDILESDGTVEIHVSPLAVPPSQEQVKALQFLLDNDDLVASNLLKAVFEIYPEERELYRKSYGYSEDMDDEEKEEFEEEYDSYVPAIATPGALKKLMRLHTIHIQSTAKDGMAYLGYEFDCNWEEEHGLGVVMHGSRVVEIGQAEVGFNAVEEEDGQVDLGLLYGEGVDLVNPNAEPVGRFVDDPDPVVDARLKESMRRLRGEI